MPATIKVNVADNSREWVADLKARFLEGGGAADEFEAHLEALNDELASRKARKAAEDIKALADEFEAATPEAQALAASEAKLAAEFQKCAAEARQSARVLQAYVNSIQDVDKAARAAGKSVGWVAPPTLGSRLSAAIANFNQVRAALGVVSEVAGKAYAAISKLAETNSKFAELKSSIDGLEGSLRKAADEFAASDFGGSSLQTSSDVVKYYGECIEALPSLWRNVEVVFNSYQAEVLEGMWLQADRQRQLISLANEEEFAIRARLELAKKEAESKASNLQFERIRTTVSKANQDTVDARNIAALQTEAQVIAAIKEEEARLKEKQETSKVTEEVAVAAIARLAALNAQRRKIQDEEVAKLKQERAEAAAKAKKDLEDKVAQTKKAEQEITAAKKKAEEERWDAWREMNARRQEAEAKAAAERVQMAEAEAQQKKAAFEKSADQQKGNAGSLLGMIRPQDVARQVADKKGRQAFDNYKNNLAQASSNKRDTDKRIRTLRKKGIRPSKALLAESKTYGKVLSDLKRGPKQAGIKARQQGYKEVMAGHGDSKDIAEAQQTLTDNVIKNGFSTGQLSKNQALALREAARVLIEQQRDISAANDEINKVQRALASMGGGKPPGNPGGSF
ncbi:MAG: hypothetical protein JWN70_4020 [Planctomycetaceae bacterium]|nr:hypothetical protein [Planctomycetaceae bacterium]